MLEVGTKAPDFELPDQNGNIVKLSSFLGKNVVLYFYPKDDTPGCTTEACSFRDDYSKYAEKNAVIIGVSKDNDKSHIKFIEKYSLPFTLVSDDGLKVTGDYEVTKTSSCKGKVSVSTDRTTYLIDTEGKIKKVYPKVKVDSHSEKILKDL